MAVLLVLGGQLALQTATAQVSSQIVFASDQLRITLAEDQGRVHGSLVMAGQLVPLRGVIQQGRLQGTFEHQGQLVPFEASLDASSMILSVAGAQYRLARQGVAPGAGTAPAPGMVQGEAAAFAARYPNVLQLPGGTALRYARDWMVQDMGGMKALLPPPAVGQAVPTAMYACLELPWNPAAPLSSPEAAGHLVGWIAQMMPGLRQLAPAEALGVGAHQALRLRFEGQAAAGIATRVELLARSFGNTLLVIVGMGDQAGLATHERAVLEGLRTAELRALPVQAPSMPIAHVQSPPYAPAPPAHAQGMGGRPGMGPLGPIDPALVGTWRSSSSHSDRRHDMTLVTETFYVLQPDGTYAYGSRMAGGGYGHTIDGNTRIVSQGYWSAANGVFSMIDQSGNRDQVDYTFHQGQWVMKLRSGKYSFWSR